MIAENLDALATVPDVSLSHYPQMLQQPRERFG